MQLYNRMIAQVLHFPVSLWIWVKVKAIYSEIILYNLDVVSILWSLNQISCEVSQSRSVKKVYFIKSWEEFSLMNINHAI